MIPVTRYTLPSGKTGLSLSGQGGPKGIIHTTEGGYPPEIEAMRNRDLAVWERLFNGNHNTWMNGRGYPTHYLVSPVLRKAHQYLDLNVGAYALEDAAGGTKTNRDGKVLVQMEVVGHAQYLTEEFTDDDWRWFGELLRQIGAEAGIPYVFPFEFLTSPAPAYGPTRWGGGAARLDANTYITAAGWIGHQHVPENLHSDPGVLRLDLMAATPNPSEEDDMQAWSDPRYINAFYSTTGMTLADGEGATANIVNNATPHDQKLAACVRASFGLDGGTPQATIALAVERGYLIPRR